MTQTLYAHINKIKIKKKKNPYISEAKKKKMKGARNSRKL
jgi:hypothetical protein